MYQKITIVFILLFISVNISLAQKFNWVKDVSGNPQYPTRRNITTDLDKNVYYTGSFEGTKDFDPGESVHNETANSKRDAFICKLDSNGGFVWVVHYGYKNNYATGANIVSDTLNNIYITGIFKGIIDFDLGPEKHIKRSKGNYSIFILKLDSDGNFIWVKTIIGLVVGKTVDIEIDNEDIIILGNFRSSHAGFPGGHVLLSNPPSYDGGTNIFLLKLKLDGSYVWVKNLGRIDKYSRNFPSAISIDNSSNIIVSGSYLGKVDFDFSQKKYYRDSYKNGSNFLLKLDKKGRFIWVITSSISINDTEIDKENNIYIIGNYIGNTEFDFGIDSLINDSSNNNYNSYILKLNSLGNFMWLKTLKGDNNFTAYITKDDSDIFYILGIFRGVISFYDPVDTFQTGAEYNTFMMKIDYSGDILWKGMIKGEGGNRPHGLTIDKSKNILICGSFYDSTDFDPGIGKYELSGEKENGNSVTINDLFILKLGKCKQSIAIQSIDTCQSYTWIDGNTYDKSTNTPTFILQNDDGCDSTINLNLTIHQPDIDTITITTCDNYIWQDSTYLQSGTYTFQDVNTYGCDSSITLNLTVHNLSLISISDTVCENYMWQGDTITTTGIYTFDTLTQYGCDSTITLNIVINKSNRATVKKTVCDSYIWHDSIYTQSGQYYFDTVNIVGCDSIVMLQLDIVEKIEKLDTIIICERDTITIFDEKISDEKLISKTYLSHTGCDSVQSIQIIVNPLLKGTFSKSICEGDSVFVIDRWLKEEGIYAISKANTQGCDSLFDVLIEQRPIASTYDTIQICKGDTIEIFGFEVSEELDLEQSFLGANDCDSTVFVHVEVLQPNTTHLQITLCPGDSVKISDEWIKQEGKYQELHTGANGCDSISEIDLFVLNRPEEPSFEIDCNYGQLILTTNADNIWKIYWNNGDTLSETKYITQTEAGLKLITSQGCIEEYTVKLPDIPNPENIVFPQDTLIDEDGSLILDLGLDKEQWKIKWEPTSVIKCDTCLHTTINTTEDVKIKVKLIHKSGCEYNSTFSITIKQKDIFIPNIFTPNADGTNDDWIVKLPKNIKLISCEIFDRWGSNVYSAKGNIISWNGIFKGKKVMQGVYVYLLTYEDKIGERKVISGDVTIVR